MNLIRMDLQHLTTERIDFVGTLEKYFIKDSIAGNVIVAKFIDVTIGNEWRRTAWVTVNSTLIDSSIREGSRIKCTCRVMPYKQTAGRVIKKIRDVEIIFYGRGRGMSHAVERIVKNKNIELAEHLKNSLQTTTSVI